MVLKYVAIQFSNAARYRVPSSSILNIYARKFGKPVESLDISKALEYAQELTWSDVQLYAESYYPEVMTDYEKEWTALEKRYHGDPVEVPARAKKAAGKKNQRGKRAK